MEKEKMLEATLGFLIKDGKIWLAVKTRKIGKGCWNGYGGGVEPEDKNLLESLKREVEQECGVQISETATKKVAIIDYHNEKSEGGIYVVKVHTFFIKDWKGEPQTSEEMATPTLFEINNLPFEKMMPADKE